MSVANSKTDIVNLALDIIKSLNVNDVEIPGDDKAAVVANRWYDNVRQDILEGFPWNFATKRSAIPLNSTAPNFGFDDAYVLPNDYISLSFIKYWDYPLSRWNYTIENGNIYIDNGGATSLQIGYTYDVQQVVKFSPSFKIFFAHALADYIVIKLTGNTTLATRVTAARKVAELSAKAKNGKANPPVAYRVSKMLQGRRVYGGSSISGLYTEQDGRT
jgi:hypothetical protein